MSATLRALAVGGWLVLAIVAAANQATGGERRWASRLEALRRDRPIEYFELAEDIADGAADDAERELARHLFALAGALDEARLGRSACLALADMEARPHVRRRLRALALLLGERVGEVALFDLQAVPEEPQPSLGALEAVCTSFSYYRRGDGPKAERALRGPGAQSLLEAHDRLLIGGVKRYLEDCRLYRGEQRRPIQGADVDQMLRLEAALLAGTECTFSADLLLREGQPLVEIEADRLEEALGVDTTRPHWRNGRWVDAALPGRCQWRRRGECPGFDRGDPGVG